MKFTPEHGRVRIEAQAGEDAMLLAVEDTGIGMSPEEVETAIRPFGQVGSAFNKRHEGTGLGLPIAHALTRLHGGELQIDSIKGRGTRVTLILPLAPAGSLESNFH